MPYQYRVTEFDDPLSLGKRFQMDPQQLLKTNGLNRLIAGQTINVPTTFNTGNIRGGMFTNIGPQEPSEARFIKRPALGVGEPSEARFIKRPTLSPSDPLSLHTNYAGKSITGRNVTDFHSFLSALGNPNISLPTYVSASLYSKFNPSQKAEFLKGYDWNQKNNRFEVNATTTTGTEEKKRRWYGVRGQNWKFKNGVTYAVGKTGPDKKDGGATSTPATPVGPINKQTQSGVDWRVGA
jgi:hypothetical protein